jgi:histidyl-tRNA synthetase
MSKVIAKPPKGTRDTGPEAMAVRNRAFALVTAVFQRHGAVAIDTPVFERREVLQNKYGEDSKLIYDLSDDMSSDTGEKLSLRYDLSVPFARYIATNSNIRTIKRYHIAKVYRRDRPAMDRGRFREFYQCDFDIAGDYPKMVADAEVLKVMTELFDALADQSSFHHHYLASYQIKLSHRKILDAILSVCGVPDDKLRAICSAVDKLDKEPWDLVRKEMVEEKGLDPDAADKIGTYVVKPAVCGGGGDGDGGRAAWRGEPARVLQELRDDAAIAGACPGALDDLHLLFEYLAAMDGLHRISFDLSLARGLDYYTGVIFEVVLADPPSNVKQLGSIGAGGRYDELVGMFRANSIPCVGCSLGIERIMNIMLMAEEDEAKAAGRVVRATCTEVLVATIGKGSMPERLRLASEMWSAGIPTQFCYNENWAVGKQVASAAQSDIPLAVVVGESELAAGVVKLKNLRAETERTVPRVELAAAIREELSAIASGSCSGLSSTKKSTICRPLKLPPAPKGNAFGGLPAASKQRSQELD